MTHTGPMYDGWTSDPIKRCTRCHGLMTGNYQLCDTCRKGDALAALPPMNGEPIEGVYILQDARIVAAQMDADLPGIMAAIDLYDEIAFFFQDDCADLQRTQRDALNIGLQ
jgi:hypothetical protein